MLTSFGYADAVRTLEIATRIVAERNVDAPVLTPAERVVLEHLGAGLSPKEIAERTGRSIYTVRAHSANAFAKLGCRGRHEAVAHARRLGVIA